ncbi:MAG: ribonuclease R [Gammaproteobacteria bacterium]|nr:MAG: ribonuclease R [Gammaproteobacteria bacterium]
MRNRKKYSADPRQRPRGSVKHRFEIPSRNAVLEILTRKDGPVPGKELMTELGLPSKTQQDAMRSRLRAMIRDGQILVNRGGDYCLVDRMSLIVGRVTGHRDGYGFLIPDDGTEDVFLAPRQMREVMHGDRLAVRIKGQDHRGRPEGSIVEVLERNTREVVGRYVRESGIGFVVPDNSRIAHTVAIPPRRSGRAKPGEIVVARLIEQPGKGTQPVGQVVEILGAPDAPNIETEVAIRAHGIPFRWEDDTVAEAEALGSRVLPRDKKDREDLRGLPLITIDGADAKDFDDAVFAERVGSGWRLIVAIADVGHYVEPDSAIDREGQERGTSVYFPRRVVPMLPESLSNGLCSLNPRVDRLTLTCEMHVDANGKVTVSRFFEAVIRSHARLIYEEVAAALSDRDSSEARRLESLMPQLKDLEGVYRALARSRRKRGAIEFEIPEVTFAFDRRGRIARVVPRIRNDAHRIIEECMIAANVQAAYFLRRHRIPCLYRVHAGPEADRLEDLMAFLEIYGIRLPRRDRVEPRSYNRIVDQVKGRPDEALIETVLLRSLPRAVYQPENVGHFGLALPEYAHFTSPIRRYPDLMVHRAIKHLLAGGGADGFAYSREQMQGLGRHCSSTERRADEATREALDWLKCEFMQDRTGEEFDAVVTGVTDFGLFVQIPDLQIEGLVHVSALGGEYFARDPVRRSLRGEQSGRSWQLANHVRVRVARVDLEEKKIDFALAGDEIGGRRGRRKGRRKR